MALSIQLHDAHLMASTSASTLLSWQLQKWPAPELQHSVRKVRFSIALAMAPEQNVTILSSSISHSSSNFVCTPASSSSVALFFFANYVAHCAPIKQLTGEKTPELFVAVVLALFFPYSGISRAPLLEIPANK
jgi:hypothetical protein